LKINPNEIKLRKQSQFIEQDKIASIHTDYPFSNNGLMLLLGKMGQKKINDALKHLLMADTLGNN
jgi:3-deoxy-D-arabino-heptulosonate 7-phosphate (DAHP) synthase class II